MTQLLWVRKEKKVFNGPYGAKQAQEFLKSLLNPISALLQGSTGKKLLLAASSAMVAAPIVAELISLLDRVILISLPLGLSFIVGLFAMRLWFSLGKN